MDEPTGPLTDLSGPFLLRGCVCSCEANRCRAKVDGGSHYKDRSGIYASFGAKQNRESAAKCGHIPCLAPTLGLEEVVRTLEKTLKR